MNQGIVASRYAKALLGFGEDRGQEDRLYEELGQLQKLLQAEPQVGKALRSPMLSRAEKLRLLESCAGDSASEEYKRFMQLLVAQKRETLLLSICRTYQELYHRAKRIIYMNVVSATELDDQVTERIRQHTEKLTMGTVRLVSTIDPSLIGGATIQWDTYRLDASVAGELKRIEKSLKL